LYWIVIVLAAERAQKITGSYNQCDTRTYTKTGSEIFTCGPRWKISLHNTEIPYEVRVTFLFALYCCHFVCM